MNAELPPYSRGRVLGLWLLATLPMVLVTWAVAPWLIPRLAWPAAIVYLTLTGAAQLVQGLLALWALRREGVPLRWETLRPRIWLQAPRHPRSHEPRPSRFLWLAVVLPAALVPLLLGNLFTASWVGLRMLRWPLAIVLSPGYAKSLDLASPELSGDWWAIGLVLVVFLLGTIGGEELLFRGVLLPRMSGTFGRGGWLANATLFALYCAYVPLILPVRFLATLAMVGPARHYRSNWFALAVRGGEGLGLLVAVLAGVLWPTLPPLATRPTFPHIERRPPAADLSRFCRTPMISLPGCRPGNAFAADVRSCDLSHLDLRAEGEQAACVSFDTRTVWPPAERMPGGFDPAAVLARNANPGLRLRSLHAQGITGRGVGVAIVDSFLLVDHEEYGERLRWYEELPGLRSVLEPGSHPPADMHAAGVAALAVGRTAGVAPAADLYLLGEGEDPRRLFLQAHSYALAIRRIVAVNRSLPRDRKIRALSISMGWGPECPGYADVTAAAGEAAREGIALFAIFLDGEFEGLGRDPAADPDDGSAYGPAARWAAELYDGRFPADHVWVPVDTRTTASPSGARDRVFYRWGASSWIPPYLAGLYALAAQVDPTITRDRFVALARATGRVNTVSHDGRPYPLGRVLDPVALIGALRAGHPLRGESPSRPRSTIIP